MGSIGLIRNIILSGRQTENIFFFYWKNLATTKDINSVDSDKCPWSRYSSTKVFYAGVKKTKKTSGTKNFHIQSRPTLTSNLTNIFKIIYIYYI